MIWYRPSLETPDCVFIVVSWIWVLKDAACNCSNFLKIFYEKSNKKYSYKNCILINLVSVLSLIITRRYFSIQTEKTLKLNHFPLQRLIGCITGALKPLPYNVFMIGDLHIKFFQIMTNPKAYTSLT